MNDLIATRLKKLRKRNRFTQEEVADALNISQSSYARIEQGKSFSWTNYLNPICSLYAIKPDDLTSIQSSYFDEHYNERKIAFANTTQISEKLIELYEQRLREKEAIIVRLKLKIQRLKSQYK